MTVGLIILAAIVIFVLSGIKVVNQYQRGVVLTLGKFTGVKSPGLRLFFPGIQSVTMVDVRSTPIDVPKKSSMPRPTNGVLMWRTSRFRTLSFRVI